MIIRSRPNPIDIWTCRKQLARAASDCAGLWTQRRPRLMQVASWRSIFPSGDSCVWGSDTRVASLCFVVTSRSNQVVRTKRGTLKRIKKSKKHENPPSTSSLRKLHLPALELRCFVKQRSPNSLTYSETSDWQSCCIPCKWRHVSEVEGLKVRTRVWPWELRSRSCL